MTNKSPKTIVENINTPGKTSQVDAKKYNDMRDAMMQTLPSQSPGFSHAEIKEAVKPLLDQTLFPGGKTSGWWSKTVQLDLEAKGVIKRSETKPLRWYKPS
ncbi:MAG: hypothetical protein AAF067_14340 [Pseudomonadota bacterium]